MANIIRTGADQTQITPDQSLDKTDFGSKVATAAVEGRHEEKHPHHHDKSMVELREEETRQIIGLSGGSITGAQVKTNKQLANQVRTDIVDAWDDPTRVDEREDLDSALEKRLQRAKDGADATLVSVEGDELVYDLNAIDTLNEVTQHIRHFSNYKVLETSPELYIVLGGLSESFDDYLASKGVVVQDPTGLSGQELAEIFALLQNKKKGLSEDEKEAELILSGAVALLALKQILEKMEELGLDPEDAMSLKGKLAELINEAQDENSELHGMYRLIKEETELSIVAPDEMDAAA